jgi:hypothetical protein
MDTSSDTLSLGPLTVIFHRTVRVAEDKLSNLPPSLGDLPIHLNDFQSKRALNEDVYCFLALHDKEALWIDFRTGLPVAVMVGAGGINALNGKPMTDELEEGNYLVTPPQPWLDGWKGEDGAIYQFVATPYKKGKGLTVGEQMLGKRASSELEIVVFESKDPNLIMTAKPQELYGTNAYEPCGFPVDDPNTKVQYAAGTASLDGFDCKTAGAMGLGKGGKISQKVYPDPYGIEVWKPVCASKIKVAVVNAVQYAEITNSELPPLPRSVEEYIGLWYAVKDNELDDVKGTGAFDKLKPTK